ncbi:MAG: hypothetical protein ABSC06_24935 [Rhodopila sp.]
MRRFMLLATAAMTAALAWQSATRAQTSDPCMTPATAIVGQPAPAALAGYNTMVMNPNIIVGQNWFPDTQDTGQRPNITANADGSLTVAGGADTWNAQMESGWNQGANGEAFGGGFYAQATVTVPGATSGLSSWTGSTYPGNQWPSWWANSVNGSIETDFMEMMEGQPNQFGFTVVNWTTSPNIGWSQNITAPGVSDLHGPNTFGFLWIPATASNGQRMVLRFGAGANSPATFSDIQVWQASTAGDTINGAPAPAMSPGTSVSATDPAAQAACEAALTAPATPDATQAAAAVTAPQAPVTAAQANAALQAASTATTNGSPMTVTDSAGNTWTVTANGTVDENGSAAVYTADVSQIVNVNGQIYQEANGHWWVWDGSGWEGVSGDPTQGPVTVTTIADAQGQNYSISSLGDVLINGTPTSSAATAAKLVDLGGVVYSEDPDGSWSSWSGGTSQPATDLSGSGCAVSAGCMTAGTTAATTTPAPSSGTAGTATPSVAQTAALAATPATTPAPSSRVDATPPTSGGNTLSVAQTAALAAGGSASPTGTGQ